LLFAGLAAMQNPNDGSGGSTRTVSTLTSLESRLLVNDRPTVYGNIEKPVEIPGTGQASTVPVRISIDLYEFFGHEGDEGLMDLALSLGGHKDAGRVAGQENRPTPFFEFGALQIRAHRDYVGQRGRERFSPHRISRVSRPTAGRR
jgi:hypothetical protein